MPEVGEAWRALQHIARVKCRLPRAEMTEVEVHLGTYSLFATDHRQQVAHREYWQISIMMVVEVASDKGQV